jgi:hypothetical protein
MAERSNAAVLKTVDCQRSGGSNPSLSASARRSFSEDGFFYGLRRTESVLNSSLKKMKAFQRRPLFSLMPPTKGILQVIPLFDPILPYHRKTNPQLLRRYLSRNTINSRISKPASLEFFQSFHGTRAEITVDIAFIKISHFQGLLQGLY